MNRKKGQSRRHRRPENTTEKPAAAWLALQPEAALAQLDGRDRIVALLLFAGFLLVYGATLCPTIYVRDAGELSAAAATWGVPHPPGYPLYTMLCGLFVRLVPAGSMAMRANLFSAACGSLAAAMVFLFCRRIGASRSAGCAAAFCLGTGATFWSQAVSAEVYCLDIVLILLTLLAALQVLRQPFRRYYVLCGLAAGFAAGHRIVNLLYIVPVAVVFMEAARRRAKLQPAVLLLPVFGAVLSGLVFLYLPVASSLNPPIDMGDPETFDRFWTIITAQPYRRRFGDVPLMTVIARAGSFVWNLPANTGIAAAAAPVGMWLLLRKCGWLIPAGLLFSAACCIVFSCLYNIPDISSYLLPAYTIVVLAAAAGFDRLPRQLVWAAMLLGLAGLPLHYRSVDLSGVRIAERFGRDVLASAGPETVILTGSDTSISSLLYLQSVEGLRPDVAIIAPSLLRQWYTDQLRRTYPHVSWPEHTPEYYLETSSESPATAWLRELIRGNMGKRDICMLEPPELKLPQLGLAEFLPRCRNIPDGLLYCIDSPNQPVSLQERIAATEAFWGKTVMPGGADTADADDIEVPVTAFSYIMARFMFAAKLVNAGRVEAALGHLRAIALADPDAIEAQTYKAQTDAGGVVPARRLGARVQKALAAPSGDRDAIKAALRGN